MVIIEDQPQKRFKVPSALEAEFWLHLKFAKLLDGLEQQYVFDTENKRKWAFDFCWPHRKIAVEVEGGVYSGGRHTRGKGFTNDCEKYNAATLQGWRMLRFTGAMVKDHTALKLTERILSELK